MLRLKETTVLQRARLAILALFDIALHELEYYTQARIGNVHEPETTGKLVAATFEHDTARPVDGYAAPQLHTYAVIFNPAPLWPSVGFLP